MVATRVVLTVDAGTHALKVGAFNPDNGKMVRQFVQRPLIVTERGAAGRIKSQDGRMLTGTMMAAIGEKVSELPSLRISNERIAAIGTSGVVTAFGDYLEADPKGWIHYFGDWLMACCMATGLSVDGWSAKTGKSVEELMKLASGVEMGAGGARFYPWANGINNPVKAANTSAKFTGLAEEMGQQYYAQVARDYPEAWARHNQ